MTTRRNPPATPESDPETAQLGTLIQSVADDWHMPPQQLGEITWRDRTSAGRAWRPRRRTGDRLIAPIAAALVASVGLAFVAVWLQQDVGIVGSSPTPGHSNRPTAAGPSASPLPNFLLNGELPSVTSVVVNAAGTYRIADLTIGTVGKALFAGPSGPSKVVARPGGGWVCVCSDWTASSANGPTEARITLRPTSADGSALPMVDVRTIAGRADPKDPASGTSQLIDVGVTGSDDGRWAFVGWSARDGAQWTAGIDVVDVASLRVVASTRLPLVKPSVTGSRPVVRAAPVASLSPDGSAIVVASFWYMDDSTASHPPQATDHWIASFNGSTIGPLSVAGTTPDTVTWEYSVGMIDASRYYALRSYASGGFTFDRLQPDGTIIGQSDVSAIGGGVDGGTLMTRIANALFIWNPQATTLVRVDLASGTVSSSKASAAAVPLGPVGVVATFGRALGNWIAPSAMAKNFLEPGVVASPDGTRIYAIGVVPSNRTDSGSAGVFVFDAATLSVIGHWNPTADFASIAISADGRYLYAAARAGVDADGHAAPTSASITVYDTTDGSIRLIAGDLGSADLSMVDRTVR